MATTFCLSHYSHACFLMHNMQLPNGKNNNKSTRIESNRTELNCANKTIWHSLFSSEFKAESTQQAAQAAPHIWHHLKPSSQVNDCSSGLWHSYPPPHSPLKTYKETERERESRPRSGVLTFYVWLHEEHALLLVLQMRHSDRVQWANGNRNRREINACSRDTQGITNYYHFLYLNWTWQASKRKEKTLLELISVSFRVLFN